MNVAVPTRVLPTAGLVVAALFALSSAAFAEAIDLKSTPLPLHPKHVAQLRVGELTYRGGIQISLATPHRRFGEVSGLLVSPDGRRLIAVQDFGWWLTAELVYDQKGSLRSIRNGQVAPLLGADGKPLTGREADAEGLAIPAGDHFGGDVLVSFERHHRVARYRLGKDGFLARPTVVDMPPSLQEAPNNGGLEAITTLADGRLLALTELHLDEKANTIGWLIGDEDFHQLTLRRDGLHAVTDLATMPGGDILVLERIFFGLPYSMRIRRIAGESIRPGTVLDGKVIAELNGGFNIDNMEGLAVRTGTDGQVFLYVISDDAQSSRQRTVLLMFLLEPQEKQ